VETGDIGPSDKFVKACDKAFPGRHGWFTRFWLRLPRAASRAYKPWFHGWVEEFERQAVILREWEPEPIPRQLQTRDYAHTRSWVRGAGTAATRSRRTSARESTGSGSWTAATSQTPGSCWMSQFYRGRLARPR
jgi:hypothetical protein